MASVDGVCGAPNKVWDDYFETVMFLKAVLLQTSSLPSAVEG